MRRPWLVAFAFTYSLSGAADEAPGWLKELTSVAIPSQGPKVPAYVLWNEQAITVEPTGRKVIARRFAVKILNAEGRRYGQAVEGFLVGSSRVRDLRAWAISPSGQVKTYGKDAVIERGMVTDDFYSDVRVRQIFGAVDPGSTFGFESTVEDSSVFLQAAFGFHYGIPVHCSRFSVTLPPGWQLQATVLNQDKLEPTVEGATQTWEMRKLEFYDDEPASPGLGKYGVRIAVSFLPPEGTSAGRVVRDWVDVSRWMSELGDPAATPEPSVVAKATQLTSGLMNERERLQALATYAQSIRYVSIQRDLGRGGGYQPHPAKDVLAKSYGDCKDKSVLMRSMAQSLGFTTYGVSAFSGDRDAVRPQWASPYQFNHAIMAIRVADSTDAPSVMNVPKLGRLLFFDPTDPYTSFGNLPIYEQGSFVLIEAGDQGQLVQLPLAPPSANLVERTIALKVLPDGGMAADVTEKSQGYAASRERARLKQAATDQYRKGVERWVARSVPGSTITKMEPEDSATAFTLRLGVTASMYGKLMQNRLLVFRPTAVMRGGVSPFTEPKRTHPIVLNPDAFTELTTVSLPEGFTVDELPDAVTVKTAFGEFRSTYEAKDGTLLVRRSLEVKAATLPPESYREVKSFYDQVQGHEQAPVVLLKR
ncbi:MAG: DUF3857 domain-containing protein [Bryobacteraceae bacterium]|nr:DUF3857 domain-containing protein [Bryobacteraceae bacterium]